jgi:hypothetical protein
MKFKDKVIILNLFIFNLFSQTIYTSNYILPEPINGFNSIQDSISYPELSLKLGAESAFRANVNIDTSGNVTDISFNPISQNNFSQIDSIFITYVQLKLNRIKWVPAKFNGKIITSKISFPFIFLIMQGNDIINHHLNINRYYLTNLEFDPIITIGPKAKLIID